jgi:DHA1 family multidrug resistance protein-like MFS transporter
LQGFFAGYGALALAMAAESAPPGRMASAIGTVQTAQRLGPALGPVIGGVLAQTVGLRQAFWFAGGFYAIGFVLVFLVYHEPSRSHGTHHSPAGAAQQVTFRDVLAFEYFVLVFAIIFGLQFVDRSLGPILPLYVAQVGVSDERVPLVSGVLFAVLAATAALGHHWCGKLLQRHPPRTVIAVGSGGAGVGMLLFVLAPLAPAPLASAPAMVALLVVAVALFGVAVGAAMTAAYTTAGGIIPASARATGFGILSSASLTAMAAAPFAAGFIAAHSIGLVFVIDTIMLAIVAVVVARMMSASLRVDMPRPVAERIEDSQSEPLIANDE